jgi:hypothetical protein
MRVWCNHIPVTTVSRNDRKYTAVQTLSVPGCQSRDRRKHTCLMALSFVGEIPTIIAPFFECDKGAVTVWQCHGYLVF